jgi:hypothetical protein
VIGKRMMLAETEEVERRTLKRRLRIPRKRRPKIIRKTTAIGKRRMTHRATRTRRRCGRQVRDLDARLRRLKSKMMTLI